MANMDTDTVSTGTGTGTGTVSMDTAEVFVNTAEVPVAEAGGDGSGGTDDGTDAAAGGDDVDEWAITSAQKETLAGLIMIGVFLATALYFHWRPGSTIFDHWGFSLVHPALTNVWWHRITYVRTMSFLVASSILSALVVYTRDRWRSLACLISPIIATMTTEYILKPVVGRRFTEVLSYPSGTTTLVGSTAMAWIIAVPRRIRFPVVVVAAFWAGLECMAVVAIEWHFPTDAVAGIVFGAGTVLLIDGLIHLAVAGRERGADADLLDADLPAGDPAAQAAAAAATPTA
jgi:membrane-associated phospholipid phosphatase